MRRHPPYDPGDRPAQSVFLPIILARPFVGRNLLILFGLLTSLLLPIEAASPRLTCLPLNSSRFGFIIENGQISQIISRIK